MNLTDRFRKALEDVRDKTLAKAASEAAVEVRAAEERGRREVLSYIGEAFVKSVVGGTVPAFSRHSGSIPDNADPVAELISQPICTTHADRLTREAKSLGLSLQLADLIEGVRRGHAADVWAYDDLLAACEDEWGTERFTKADRSHLVRKVIQNKLGRRQVVWVKPQEADNADRGVPLGEDGKPVQGAKPQPVAKTREQLAESRTVIANAVADPDKLNPEQVRALADHIDSITKDEAKGLLKQLGQKVSGDQMAVAGRLLEAIRAGRDEGRATGAALAEGREPGDHLPTHADVKAARAAVEAAGGAAKAPLATADALRQAESKHRQAMRADLRRTAKDEPLAQPTATRGKPELTGPTPRVVNWARGERKKVLDQFAGTDLEGVAQDYFERLKTADAVLKDKDRHAANIKQMGEKTPDFDARMSQLDPRDSGQVEVPAKTRPPAADDRDVERYDAAKEKLGRMEGWQADRPSVAADNAVAGARERVRGVVGEEGQGEVAKSPGKAAAQDEKATSSKITAPQSKIKDAFEQAKQELKDVSNGKVKFASPKDKVDRIDHLRDVMGVYDTLSRHTRDKSELGDLGHSGEAIADALSRIGEGGDPAKESDSGGEKKPVTPTPAKPTDGMDTNQPTADVQKRIAQIRSRLADADNPDVGMPYGEQMKLMDELDRLTTPPEELRRREVATSAGSRIRSAMIEAARKAEEQTKSRQTNVEGKNKDEIAAGHTARGLQATEAKRLASDLEGMKQYRAMSDDERDALGTVSRQFFYQMYRKYGNKYGNAADLHPEDVAKMVDNHKKAGMQVPKEIAEQHAKHTAQAPTTTAHPDDAELAALNRKPVKQLTPAKPTGGMDTANKPTADTQKRISQIRARLAQADDMDGPGVSGGEQIALMKELDSLTGKTPAQPAPADHRARAATHRQTAAGLESVARDASAEGDREAARLNAVAARASREAANTHDEVATVKRLQDREREALTADQERRRKEAEAKIGDTAGRLDEARAKEEAAKKRVEELRAGRTSPQSPTTGVDKPTTGGNTTPVQPQSAGANQGGVAMDATTTWQAAYDANFQKHKGSGLIDSASHENAILDTIKSGHDVPDEAVGDGYDLKNQVAAVRAKLSLAKEYGGDYAKRLGELAKGVGKIHQVVRDHGGGKLTVVRKQLPGGGFDEHKKGDILDTADGPKIVSAAGKPYRSTADGQTVGYQQDISVRDPKKAEIDTAKRAVAAKRAYTMSPSDPQYTATVHTALRRAGDTTPVQPQSAGAKTGGGGMSTTPKTWKFPGTSQDGHSFDATTLEQDKNGYWTVGVSHNGKVWKKMWVLHPDANGTHHGGLVWDAEKKRSVETPKRPLSREEAEQAVQMANEMYAAEDPELNHVNGDPSLMERFDGAMKNKREGRPDMSQTFLAQGARSVARTAGMGDALERGKQAADDENDRELRHLGRRK